MAEWTIPRRATTATAPVAIMRSRKGAWEGEYIDVSGQRVTEIPVADRESDTGKFALQFRTDDEPYVVSGPCRFRRDGDALSIEVPVPQASDALGSMK